MYACYLVGSSKKDCEKTNNSITICLRIFATVPLVGDNGFCYSNYGVCRDEHTQTCRACEMSTFSVAFTHRMPNHPSLR